MVTYFPCLFIHNPTNSLSNPEGDVIWPQESMGSYNKVIRHQHISFYGSVTLFFKLEEVIVL
jgi:hypothetical protein